MTFFWWNACAGALRIGPSGNSGFLACRLGESVQCSGLSRVVCGSCWARSMHIFESLWDFGIYDPGSAVPPPPPPQWFLPTPPLWCGVVVGCFPPPPVVWCGVVVGCFPLPVVWCGSGVGFGGSPPSPPVAWCGLGGSPLHVWICLGCLANPCS